MSLCYLLPSTKARRVYRRDAAALSFSLNHHRIVDRQVISPHPYRFGIDSTTQAMMQPFLKCSYHEATTRLPRLQAIRYDGMLLSMRRSMATQRPNREKDKAPEPESHIRIVRPALLYSTTGRAMEARAKEYTMQHRAKLLAEVDRAKARLATRHTPQQLHTFSRLHAALEALTAGELAFSADRNRQLCELDNAPDMIRWIEEQRQLEKTWLQAIARSTSLSIFAPMGDIGVLRRLGKPIAFVGAILLYCFNRSIAAFHLAHLRWRFTITEEKHALSNKHSFGSKSKRRM